MKHLSFLLKMTFVLSFLFISLQSSAQSSIEVYPAWRFGEIEIHHIYTGRGEGVFCIFPDGTNMLIDAGDIGPYNDPRTTHGSPDEARQPGEWIARYISKLLDYRTVKTIDYAFLTHFHGDHLGGFYPNSPKTMKGGDYTLSGLSEVAEYIPFKKMVDRDWPTYEYPIPQKGSSFNNYKNFIDWNIKNAGMQMERFVAGSNTQFSLLFEPEKFTDFEVRNIVSNGEVWTGKGNKTKKYFPAGDQVSENKVSAGIRISYGDFDYFNGGDICGRISINTAKWRDIETPVGKAVGPVEVCEVNHHAWIDAMNDSFVASTRPQVFIMQVWNATHINLTTLQTMTSKELYPGDRYIIPTNIPEITKAYIGEANVNKLTGSGGHVVVKVNNGGKTFTIYLLTTEDESMRIKTVFGPFECK